MTDQLAKLSSIIYTKIRDGYSRYLAKRASAEIAVVVPPMAGAITPENIGAMPAPGMGESECGLGLGEIMEGQSLAKDTAIPSLVLQVSDKYPNVDPNLIHSLVEEIWAYGYVLPSDNDGKVVALDFDGTLAERAEFPAIGEPISGAVDNARKLAAEGWKLVVFASRASLPGGREQIAAWLSQQGVPVGAILPRAYARWYVSDQHIEFDGDWDNLYSKLHYDIPTSTSGPRITAAAVRSGDFTLKAIARKMGFNQKDFVQDIKSLFAAMPATQRPIVEAKLRSRYGIDISVTKLAAHADPNQYVLDRIATTVAKIELNKITEGDQVMVVAAGPNLGDTGVVTEISRGAAVLALDGVGNTTLQIPDYANSLRLLSGTARHGSLAIGARSELAAHPSKFYPNGLPLTSSGAWYDAVQDHMFRKSYGFPATTTYAVSGGEFTHIASTFNPVECNLRRLKSVLLSTPDNAATAAVMIQASPDKQAACKVITQDLVHTFTESELLTDASLRFNGDNGYCVVLKYAAGTPDSAVARIVDDAIHSYIADAQLGYVTTDLTAAAGSVRISRVHTGIPAAYSLHPRTGLACLPLSLDMLPAFEPENAVITKILK